MPLDRAIVVDEEFEATEEAQKRFSVLLRERGPPARPLPAEERNAVWQTIRGEETLRTFPSSGLQRFNHNHAALPDGRALFIFQGDALETRLLFLTWGSEFGVSFRAILKLKHGIRQVALLPDDPAFEAMWSGKVVLAFLRLGKLEKACELDYTARTEHANALAYMLKLAERTHGMRHTVKSAYASPEHVLAWSWSTAFSREWTRADWLQHGWITSCKTLAPALARAMPQIASACQAALPHPELQNFPAINDALQTVARETSHKNQIDVAIQWMLAPGNAARYTLQAGDFYERRGNAGEDLKLASEGAVSGVLSILYAIDMVPAVSRYGLRQSYLDCTTYRIEGFDLAPDQFAIATDEAAKDYWNSKQFNIPFDGHRYLSPGDFPAQPPALLAGWANAMPEIDLAAAEETIDHLLDEAIALKKWTIPPRARVEIEIGPFVAVEVTEIHNEVYFLWRTPENHYWLASVGIRLHAFALPQIGKDGTPTDPRIAAELKLLMAALVRDFWVAEERHKIFDVMQRHGPRQPGESARKRIIYLPRIRYDRAKLAGGLAPIADGLNHAARSRHFVRYSFRKAENPSPLQMALARRQNITVPPGHTYVKPHYRGHGQGEVLYRSRSAMQLIFDTVERPLLAALSPVDDWFEFERMIGILLEDHLAFKILQRAVRGRGDDGIDIIAAKSTRSVNELWVIQCKRYAHDHPVGPAVVRELLGSMTDLTPDPQQAIRGIIVTTSRFTPDALRLSAKHGIQTLNGDDLTAVCSAINRQASPSLAADLQ